jgi:hypothetical protein
MRSCKVTAQCARDLVSNHMDPDPADRAVIGRPTRRIA